MNPSLRSDKMANVVDATLQELEQAIPIVRASQCVFSFFYLKADTHDMKRYMILSGCSLLLYDYFLTVSPSSLLYEPGN